ncbi:MAG: VOC family protein [Microbacteriaceae bacterium]|nr:VOC family protein [Microbacteriaceae bacterium]MCL2796258.1 VOC family protein [Microbacteriaceae bacterium]
MAISFTPYLQFRGHAREAMTFYQSVFGGELNVLTFEQGGMTEGVDPQQVMHSQLDGPVGLMGSDVPEAMALAAGSRISLCFSGSSADLDTAKGYYAKLVEGGEPGMPLEQAPWGDYFGDLTDRFGIAWMFNFGDSGQGQ